MMRSYIMKTKILALLMALVVSSPAFAGRYLCSYTAYISEDDKMNSSGYSLVTGTNKSTVAAILQQDRANFYKFGIRDAQDTSDCIMRSQAKRSTFGRLVNRSAIPQSTIRKIVHGNPTIEVDLYTDRLAISAY